MKLAERSQVQTGIGENNSFVSSPPSFDMERARKVSDIANEWLAKKEFGSYSALAIACKLGLYNLPTAQPLDPNTFHFSKRFGALAQNEAVFADPAKPFPTVGIEVEVPRKIVGPADLSVYAEFFDKLGMPRNQENKKNSNLGQHWEFSPNPSFCSGTQSRIISELIQGGFIPSLSSQEPEDIRRYLDNKLVSLHVNLGIPMDTSAVRGRNDNFEAFSNMFSLAFTSSLRLKHRYSKLHFYIKPGEPTSKSKLLGQQFVDRLELKALEVRTGSTYRLLRESQLLAGALFAFLGNGDSWLSQKWQEFREKTEPLTRKTFWGQPFPLSSEEDRDFMVRKLKSTQIQQQLRNLITEVAAEIAKRYRI